MEWTAAEPPDASETASLTSSPSRHRKRHLGRAQERCLGVVTESSILSADPSIQFDQFVCFANEAGGSPSCCSPNRPI
jgi:hypothetical protein